jgi:multiple sugar transport system permease protein
VAHARNLAPRPEIAPSFRLSNSQREALVAVGFLAPGLLIFLIFSLGPTVFSLVMSFTSWNGLGTPLWTGFENYIQLLRDSVFVTSLGNTMLFTIEFVVLCTVCSTCLAVALNRRFRGVSIVRLMWFLPIVTDMISISLVWAWLYDRNFGIINYVIGLFGLPAQSWLSDTRWALFSLVLLSAWRWAGYYAIIQLAALQGIPQELYEAAIIDGAKPWQKFRRITLPLISPAIFFVVTLSVISSFQVFEQMWVMTQGGPENSTISIAMYLYEQAFQFLNMGYASAVAWVLFFIIFAVTLLNWRIRKLWVFES